MMKFLFALIGGVFLISLNSSYFWLVSNFFVFLFIMFLLMVSSFLEFYIYSFDFSIDMASYSLIVLSFWVTILMYYSSSGVKMNNSSFSYFFLCIYFLMLILFLSFSCLNILGFYFFFEASLIPTLLIILGWGYQPERLQAGVYFLFYTLTASLPLLLVLMYIYYTLGSLDSIFFNYLGVKNLGGFIFLMMTLAFLVKMPMFFTHLWLPKAHVEAPVSGSMILAGVLLKLGGYGLYRVLPFCLNKIMAFSNYLYGVSILGMLYVGIMCCRLNDLKALVAYSSVAHMGLVVCGIFSCFIWGYTGSLMMMISHGLASSGLFCIVNMYYERLGSRSLYLNKGLILILPLFSFFFFVLCAANMASPPTVNLLSEIFLMATILKFDKIMFLVFPLGSYLGAVFTLFMFSYSQHGKSYYGVYSYLNVSFREYHTLILHVLPVNFLILKSEYFMYLY